MKLSIIATALALALAGNAYAQGTPSPQGKKSSSDPAADRISADYKAASEACKPMKGNAQDVCKAEAKAKRDVAKAELNVQKKDTAENRRKLAEAQAKGDYDVAKERCEDQKGDAQKSCEKEAKSKRDAALAQAKGSSGSTKSSKGM
jgi:hypothetical protein